MNETSHDTGSIVLSGLNGSNPLAFLAALGTLRTCVTMYPDSEFRMGWDVIEGAWRPRLSCRGHDVDKNSLCDAMADWLAAPLQCDLLEAIGDNLTLHPARFRELARQAYQSGTHLGNGLRTSLDFLAAFGSDATYQSHSKDRSLIQDTALRTMSGAGHQHFIKFMREIIANTTAEHLHATLFEPWSYRDEGRGMNLRWDPLDDRRYAMRWKNPSSDPAVTMRGANRLAIEGLPLFPTAPMGNDLETTGFKSISKRGTFWTWPIWKPAITLASVRSLLQHPAWQPGQAEPADEDLLGKLGVATLFRSQRITVGKFRNFTPAKSIA